MLSFALKWNVNVALLVLLNRSARGNSTSLLVGLTAEGGGFHEESGGVDRLGLLAARLLERSGGEVSLLNADADRVLSLVVFDAHECVVRRVRVHCE